MVPSWLGALLSGAFLKIRCGAAVAPIAVASEVAVLPVGSAGLVGSGERPTSRGGAVEPGTRAESTRDVQVQTVRWLLQAR